MMDDQHRKIFARLSALASLSEATITAKPMPHLQRAARRIHDLESAIEDTLMILDGIDDLDIMHNISLGDIPIGRIDGMAVARNEAAYQRLDKALKKPLEHEEEKE